MKKAKESIARRTLVFMSSVLMVALIMASAMALSGISVVSYFRLFPDIRFQQSEILGSAIRNLFFATHELDGKISDLTKSGQIIELNKLSDIYSGADIRHYADFQETNLKFIYINNKTGVAITNLPAAGQTAADLADQLMQGDFAFSLHDSPVGTIDTGANTLRTELPYPYNMSYWSHFNDNGDVKLTVSLIMPLLSSDWLLTNYQFFQTEKAVLFIAPAVILVCLLLLILSWVYLIRHAGRQTGSDQIRLSWFDRIYGDILGFVLLLFLIIVRNSYYFSSDSRLLLFYIMVLYVIAGPLLLSIIRRHRAGILISQNLWHVIIHAMRLHFRQNTLFRKAVISWITVGLLIVIIPMLLSADARRTMLTQFLLLLTSLIIYLPVFKWITQFQAVNQAVDSIGREPVQCSVSQDRLAPDLQKMMFKLAAIGGQTQAAVAEKVKSERLKTDLITNVSHDLKTPLTSIINYLDLLKMSADDPAKRSEYLGVLEQKTQRLKTLTESLTEAAKASSGSLPVLIEPVNLNELVRQVAGEYADRLASRRLALIVTESKDESGNAVPILINSDGRHIWRILDNLLTNVCKYAQEGTRVYLDLRQGSEMAALEIKNISQEPLNCSPDELQQRFVRGDASRHTEGSGLGLAIATSLAELLGGKLQVRLDGDLFKSIVTLPL